MGGGLYDPLGTGRARPARARLSAPVVAAVVILGAVIVLGTVALLRNGGDRGEPRAVVTIERPPPPATPAQPAAPAATVAAPAASAAIVPAAPAADGREADVEIQNGVRVVRMRSDVARSSSRTIVVPPAAPAPSFAPGGK